MNVGTEYAFLCRVGVSQARVGVEVLRDGEVLFRWLGHVAQVAQAGPTRAETVELRTAYYSSSRFKDLRLRMLAGQAAALFPD
jgi:hypothetical protein